MKKLLYAALIICASVSCKKQGAPAPKEKLLSSIYEDDKLRYSFEYTSGKKLKKVKKYADGAVAPIMEDTYEYDGNGYLKEKLRVQYGAPVKYIYECNNTGQVTKAYAIDAAGADSGEVENWMAYTYDANHKLIKINYYSADNTSEGYEILDYADNGGLTDIKLYDEKPIGSEIVVYWKYHGASNRLNPGILKAYIEPDKKELMYLDAKSIDITTYTNGFTQAITKHTISDREAGGPGIFVQQKITTRQVYPVESVPQSKQMKYEYVEM